PENVPKIQKAIADIDETIERTEKIMALERELFLERQKADKQLTELMDLADKIEPELRAYVAEHHPEKLELLDAMLSDDDKTNEKKLAKNICFSGVFYRAWLRCFGFRAN